MKITDKSIFSDFGARHVLSKKRGFSLIELLVVATIIIILAAIGMVSFTNAGRNARNGKRKTDMETVRQAIVLYRADEGAYPPGGNYGAITGVLTGDNYLSQPVPQDPQTPTQDYRYVPTGTTGFCLCAQLEGTNMGNSTNNNCNFGTGNFYCVTQP